MSAVDDFGRYDGRSAILRSKLYPLKLASVSEADVSSWMAECLRAGLVSQYIVAGKPYILFLNLGEPRARVSKFPAPDGATKADAFMCEQVLSYVPPSPSPSPSPSSVVQTPLWANGEHPFFEEFWKAYPHQARRLDAARALASLNPDRKLFDTILAAIEAQKCWPKWTDKGSKFIPLPGKWINDRGWEDKPPENLKPARPAMTRDIYDEVP